MNRAIALALCVAATSVNAQRASAQTTDASRSVTVADSLFTTMKPAEAMAVLHTRLEKQPDDFDALWRHARSAIVLTFLTDNRDERMRLLQIAVASGDRLLSLRPGDTLALAWNASAKGRLAMIVRNPVTSAKLAKEVWTLTGTLLAAEPNNALANGIRGKFIQEVRKLSWAERVFARIVLGGDIAGAVNWDDSERYLKRALENDPQMIVYHLDLGDTYRLQRKDSQAMAAYRLGLSLPSQYPVDDYYKRRIREGIQRLPASLP